MPVPVSAPVSFMDPSDGGSLVSLASHLAVVQQLQTLTEQYMVLSTAYGTLLETRGPSGLMATRFVAGDYGASLVYDIAMSVFRGLHADIQQLPSTSSGHPSAPLVTSAVERAQAEFQRRVSELFGP